MASFTAGLTAALPHPELTKPTGEPAAPEPKKDAPAPVPPSNAQPAPPAPPPVEEKIPRSAQEWKKFTTKRDADIKERDERIAKAEARAAELESKLKTPAPTPELEKLKTDLEAMKKERDEYDERL